MNFLAAIGLTLFIHVAEMFFPRPPRSEASDRDRGSILAFGVAMPIGYLGAFGVALLLRPQVWWAAVLGIVVGIFGTGLRAWSIYTLGRWFTRTVQVSGDQPVIDTGPYRLIRHPSYTGLTVAFLGVGIALGTPYSPVLAVVPMMLACWWRTRIEEAALLEQLGDRYRAYMARTKRFIPYVV